MYDESKNPSDSMVASQVEKAASIWKNSCLEAEESLIPSSLRSSAPAPRVLSEATSMGKSGSAAKTPKGGKAGKAQVQPLVHASKLRAKTAKDFSEVQRLLKKAFDVSENILTVVAPDLLAKMEHGTSVHDDPSLQLLRSRQMLVKVAMKSDVGVEGSRNDRHLYELCLADPYLKDLQMTLLSDEASVQCLGSLSYCRRVTLDL